MDENVAHAQEIEEEEHQGRALFWTKKGIRFGYTVTETVEETKSLLESLFNYFKVIDMRTLYRV